MTEIERLEEQLALSWEISASIRERLAGLLSETEDWEPPFPAPSECRDPVRLARLRPKTVRQWLKNWGWKWFGSREFARQGADGGPEFRIKHLDETGCTFQTLTIAGEALDIWPGQVLALLEEMQEEEDSSTPK